MAVVLVLAVGAAQAQQARLLVDEKGDRSLAIVDPVAGKVVADAAEGGITGHEVAGSPDGKLAFVPIYGNSGVGKPGTDGKKIVVIDVATGKVTGEIDFDHGVRPHCAVFGPDGMLYVTTELDHSVTIIDPKTLKIVGSIPTGQPESHMFTIAHNGLRGYTANVGPGTVSVLDMKARKTLAVIPISGNTQRIAISNDDKLGVYRRPDGAAPGGDRYGDEFSEDLGEARRAGLRRCADARWTLVSDLCAG